MRKCAYSVMSLSPGRDGRARVGARYHRQMGARRSNPIDFTPLSATRFAELLPGNTVIAAGQSKGE